MGNQTTKHTIPATIQNGISSELHRAAAKKSNPVEGLDEIRRALMAELGISPKMLRFYETNVSQPSILELAQIKAVLAQMGHEVQYESLINP